MNISTRKNNILAANFYFLWLLIAIFVHLSHQILEENFTFSRDDFGPTIAYFISLGLTLALMAGFGYFIRAGKLWAKVIFILYTLYLVYEIVPAVYGMMGDTLWMLRSVPQLVAALAVTIVMLKGLFTRHDPALGGAQGGHNRVN
ncbi:hypothetical protein [Hymenobacter sp. BT190]|uniref:hypothetical protein n=1 Tax=Hymenobacter sp. BT190 TaxID=2763505 RepID=UPI0016510E16|nr:hypothetical protein [Hymenobacter sp. BT190]MBC6698904.1 hypothetical protein [Hymenobacter sp. BT190]